MNGNENSGSQVLFDKPTSSPFQMPTLFTVQPVKAGMGHLNPGTLNALETLTRKF